MRLQTDYSSLNTLITPGKNNKPSYKFPEIILENDIIGFDADK